ncbi:uncharacterized protein METZ01_LOCUS95526 [marine metagenome]|uniref:CSD domain-containing protein n=1 Tax=marine metagenome TaxID=408172 RepID=A0A381VQV1_9ZZZZ|tara:strand:- start:2628 stop:3236 length:609 start_codon:yes stop_codon:yes gene_type:complete
MSQTEQSTEQSTEQQSVEQQSTEQQSTEQQSTEQSVPQAHTGRVKWFNNTRGYGFLTYKDENGVDLDVFVHFSSIRSQVEDSFKTLTQGEYVSFDLADSNKEDKLLAVNVTGVNGGPLLSDQRALNRERRNEYNGGREDGQGHREERPRHFRQGGGRGRGRGGFRGPRDNFRGPRGDFRESRGDNFRGPRGDEPRRPFNPEH